MMGLFRKRKVRDNGPNELLVRVREFMEPQQRKFADYLGRKTQYWNRGSKVTALTLFILLFGGGCLLLLIRAIIHF
ncbi:MAG: hypothetical protein JST32_11000 [Bacteroidetes bacterium]|nr:hypothetical protein [Bacteroidota bacterium]